MTSSIFPDVNVWLALSYARHSHHQTAIGWYQALDPLRDFVFCRHTQLGLFRLLSTEVIMKEDVLTQDQCWGIYDRWIDSGETRLAQEPAGIEAHLRTQTSTAMVTPKAWADVYLAAFAAAAGIQLVTFDRALASRAEGAVLLG